MSQVRGQKGLGSHYSAGRLALPATPATRFLAGRAHANQGKIRVPEGGGYIRRRGKSAHCHLPPHDLADVLFDNRGLAGVDEIHLARLRIDADDFVAFLGQAARRNGSDIAETQHTELPIGSAGDFAAKNRFAREPRPPQNGPSGLLFVEPPRYPAEDGSGAAEMNLRDRPHGLRKLERNRPPPLAQRVPVGDRVDLALLAAME